MLLDLKVPVGAADVADKTALFFASHTGDLEGMAELISAKADVGAIARRTRNQTPLFFAVSPEATLALLTHGADPNSPDAHGQTPIFYAAGEGNVPRIKALVEGKADVTIAD